MTGAEILSGVTMATFAASGLFFLKSWRVSRDRFFLLFSSAFFLMAIERFMTFFTTDTFDSMRPLVSPGNWMYVFRLVAFVVILAAIFEKNRSKGDRDHSV